jgi:endonuclease YncB( thermonuclease family)
MSVGRNAMAAWCCPELAGGLSMTLRPIVALVGVVALVAAGVALSASHQPAQNDPIVIDGDTLDIDGKIVQLYGIDAPELGQLCDSAGILWQCGVEAALALRKLVTLGNHGLTCAPWTDDPDRTTAHGGVLEFCKLGHEDVALVMLLGGHSVALPGSFPDYLDAQEQARRARLGVWHSRFAMPWDWRARADGTDRRCNVKGVVDAEGQRHYYVPTDADYGDIEVAPGARLFCSDEEARTAGWAHPTGSSG